MVVFACQRDSFQREFVTNVLSCTEAELKTTTNGKIETLKGYEVICEDTILFPEGGGQPCDHGYMNDIKVLSVLRRGAVAVHFVEEAVEPGKSVKQLVDWERRLDHMQQHSGQHLLTAITDAEFGYETTSWWLGEEVSYVELDTPKITDEEIEKLECLVNEKIRLGLAVTVDVYQAGDPYLSETRTRGLPIDHVGDVRVVTIEDVDSNMCCGTHVSNLSQLQAIKLLGAEKGKNGKINLMFLVGGRVLKRLSTMLQREQALTAILKNAPEDHVDLVDKLMKSAKLAKKNLQSLLREKAVHQAKGLKTLYPKPKYFLLHQKEAEMDFVNTFIKEVNDPSYLLFLTIGDEKTSGHMIMYGEESLLAELGPKSAELLAGKGNGKGNRYQAKVTNMANRDKVIQLIRDKLSNFNS